jgi:hypothetical protein
MRPSGGRGSRLGERRAAGISCLRGSCTMPAWPSAADGTDTSLAEASGVVTNLMRFSSLPSRAGSRGGGRRGAAGSLVTECQDAGDAEGRAMTQTRGEPSSLTVEQHLIRRTSLGGANVSFVQPEVDFYDSTSGCTKPTLSRPGTVTSLGSSWGRTSRLRRSASYKCRPVPGARSVPGGQDQPAHQRCQGRPWPK